MVDRLVLAPAVVTGERKVTMLSPRLVDVIDALDALDAGGPDMKPADGLEPSSRDYESRTLPLELCRRLLCGLAATEGDPSGP